MVGKGIDDMCIAHQGQPLGRIGDVGMNVAMDKITGFESVDDAVMPPTWGSNVDTYYLYPR